MIVFPEYGKGESVQFDFLSPLQTALRLVETTHGLNLDDTRRAEEIVSLSSSLPAIRVRYSDFIEIDGILDRIMKFTLSEKLLVKDFARLFGSVGRESSPMRYRFPTIIEEGNKRFTIGMATYDDYDGVYFSIQSIRLHHPEILEDCELLIIDNHPDGPCGQPLKDLEKSIPSLRYVP